MKLRLTYPQDKNTLELTKQIYGPISNYNCGYVELAKVVKM